MKDMTAQDHIDETFRLLDLAETEMNKKNQSGFEDDPACVPVCRDLSHRPPTGMVIPQGKRYRHVCPGCGNETLITPPRITY